MKTEQRELSILVPNTMNTRRHNNAQIEELWKSVDKFGAIRPIVIDENNVILAGHGLYEAYKSHDVKNVDVLVMNNLSESDKKKLMLADNKIFSMGADNFETIEAILSELGQANDFEVPGYDSETLEQLYGLKSVEEEVEKHGTPVERAVADSVRENSNPVTSNDNNGSNNEEPVVPVPPKSVSQAREEAVAEAERFVICPNCGEKVYI